MCMSAWVRIKEIISGKEWFVAAPKNSFCDGNDFDAVCKAVCVCMCVVACHFLCICPGVFCRSNALAV